MNDIYYIKKMQEELKNKGIINLSDIQIKSHSVEEFYKYTAMAFTVLSIMSNLGIKANEHIVHTNNGDYIKGNHLDRFLPLNSQYDFRSIWVDLDKVKVVKDDSLIDMLNMLDD